MGHRVAEASDEPVGGRPTVAGECGLVGRYRLQFLQGEPAEFGLPTRSPSSEEPLEAAG